MLKKKIVKDIIVDKGYYDKFIISKKETHLLYQIIKKNFLKLLKNYQSETIKIFNNIDLKNYHQYSHLLNHQMIMQKKNRLISPRYISEIKKMKFYKKLKIIFNNFKILNFEKIYDEEIDWRIVRPFNKDVSPLHRDEWFWTLNKVNIKKEFTRIKIWIPIFCEKGKNGLRYVPKSHLEKIVLKNKNKRNDGLVKPGVVNKKMNVRIFNSSNGQCFIFNDKLMHGGLSGGRKTRISLEFTILIRNKELNKYLV